MATLHIEHPVTDFGTWKAAFGRFAEVREKSGVRGHRVPRPVDDARDVVIDLDFQTAGEAGKFLDFLKTSVWSSAPSAPALLAPRRRESSSPLTRHLNRVPSRGRRPGPRPGLGCGPAGAIDREILKTPGSRRAQ